MTEYTDVPAANALHAESQQIISAIANIDAGGTVVSMTIGAPPPVIPEPGEPGAPPPMVPMLMSVNVIVPPPVDPALTAQIRSWMDQRLLDISDEMTALGVVVPPVAGMASVQSMPSSLPQYPPMSVLVPPTAPSIIPPASPTPRMPEPPATPKEE